MDFNEDLLYTPILKPQEEEEEFIDSSSPYSFENRGTGMDLLSSGARGVANVVGSIGAGLEQLGISNPIDEWAKRGKKEWSFLKPDVSEAMGLEGPVVRGLKSIPETMVTSIGSTVPGAIAGFAATGNPIGAAVGGVGNMLLTMGLGTYKEKKDEYLAKNPGDEDGAIEYAGLYAGAEVGLEVLSNAAALATFSGSKVLANIAKQGVKATARNLLSLSGKDIAKAATISGLTELGTEEATYGIQSSADERFGMGEGPTAEGAIETGVATIGMSLLFAGAGTKYNYDQKNKLKNALKSDSKLAQTTAANLIKIELEKSGDADLAQAWDSYTSSYISSGQKIHLNDDFVELGNKINSAKTFRVEDIVSSNPDDQKAAAEKIFADNGLNLDGSFIGPVTFEQDLDQYLPETEEAQANRLFKEEEGRAKAYTFYKNQPKNKLGDIATGATEQELRDFVGNLGPESWVEKDNAPLGTTTRQPSMTEEEIQNKDLEAEAEVFQKASLLYNQSKNSQNKVTATRMLIDFQQQREDNLSKEDKATKELENARVNKLIEEAMPPNPNTNDLDPLPDEEAKSILHTNLSNYKKTIASYMGESDLKEMATLRNSTNTIIRTMMQEVKPETNDLAPIIKKAEEVESKAIKGSRQAKEAKAVVKVAKKLQVAKAKEAVDTKVKIAEATKRLENVPLPATTPVATSADELIPDETITIGSLENTKGVESATTLTPEDILQNKETIKANPQLLMGTEEDTSDEGVVKRAAEATGDPLLVAIVNEDDASISSILNKINPASRQAVVKDSIKKFGAGIIKYGALVGPKLKKAMDIAKVRKQKDVEGSKETDAITWDVTETGSEETEQKGKHEETGEEVFIMNALLSYDPTQEGRGEEIDVKDISDQWEVYVGGKKVETVKGKVKARQAVERYVAPLSAEALKKKAEGKSRAGKKLVKVSEEDKELLKEYNKKKETSKPKGADDEAKAKGGEVVKRDPKDFVKDKTGRYVHKSELRDEAPATRLRKAEGPKESVSSGTGKLLDSVNWDLKKALKELEKSPNTRVQSEILNLISKQEGNLKSIIDEVGTPDAILAHVLKSGSKIEQVVARLVQRSILSGKMKGVKVTIDLKSPTSYYNSERNEIHLNTNSTRTALHELIHAFTVRELEANSKVNGEIKTLMEEVFKFTLSEDIFTQYQIDYIKNNSTSKSFKSGAAGVFFGDQENIAYALINPREFITQALTDPAVQKILKEVKVEKPTSIIKTLWDKIVKVVGNALGLSNMHHNALSQILSHSVELMGQEAIKATESIDQMFAGESSLTVDSIGLEEAKAMKEDGKTRRLIHEVTGWWEIIPGQWSYELDDNEIDLKERQTFGDYGVGETTKLGFLIEHPTLFKAYPRLKTTNVKFDNTKNSSLKLNNGKVTITLGKKSPDLMESLVHEIQHAIQTIENWGRGGSPSNSLRNKESFDLDKELKLLYIKDLYRNLWIATGKKIKNAVGLESASRSTHEWEDSVSSSFASGDITIKEYNGALSLLEGIDSLKEELYGINYVDKAFEKYMLLTGEVESRLVERRLMLSKEERETLPPWIDLVDMLDEEGLLLPGQNVKDVLITKKTDVTASKEEKEKRTRKEIEKEIDDGIKKYIGKDVKTDYKELATRTLQSAETLLSKVTQSTYEALATIAKPLAEKMRWMEKRINQSIKKWTGEGGPFEKKFRGLSKYKRQEGTLYMRNTGDIYGGRLSEWLKAMDLAKEWKKLQNIRKEIYDEAELFGLNEFDFVDNTIPLYVKDYEGLLSYLRKQEDWGIIDEVIKAAEDEAEKKGKHLGDNDKAQIVTDMLFSGRMPMSIIRKPSSLKQRTVGIITPGMLQYYYDPIESFGRFIREMTERIEINRMLGLTGYKEKRNSIRTKLKEVEKLKGKGAEGNKLQPLLDEIFALQDSLPDIEAQIEGGIGDLLAKMVKSRDIAKRDQQRAENLIRARVTQVGAGKVVSAIRSAALIGSLTQLSTGLRNISDMVWSMYNNGILTTLSSAIRVATGSADVKENPFDFQNPLKEYSTTTRLVDTAIKMSGLMYVDNFLKKVNMEASLTKAKKQSKEEFTNSWGEIFGDKTTQVYKDIQEGKMTEDVEYLLFSDISNFQPITISEMPEAYLKAGNGRILYLLKAYSLKSANNFYRESIKKMRNGDVKGGIRNLVHLSTLFIMIGASTDWLIDWLNGKQPDFTDSMVDTLFTLGITSRYTLDKSKKEGLIKSQLGNAIPPTGIFDLPFKDLMALIEGDPTFQSLKLLPAVGTGTYNNFTEGGQKSIINASKKKLYEGVAKGERPDADMLRDINRSVKAYNRNYKPNELLKEVTPGTLSSVRTKAKKKEAEEED